MAVKPKDALKAIDEVSRTLKKEQSEWGAKKGTIQRDVVKLKSEKQVLQRQTEEMQATLDAVSAEYATEKLREAELSSKNTQLEHENHRLEQDVEKSTAELVEITEALAKRKATLDTELEDYTLMRKGIIKESILEENGKLDAIKTELKETTEQLEVKKAELSELNQIYRDEQAELKESNAETTQALADNREQVTKARAEIDEVKRELGELYYKKDQVMISLTKAREEHDKLIDYEKQARKLLDTKDRELQQKAAEISEGKQFLNNSRSFLSEL